MPGDGSVLLPRFKCPRCATIIEADNPANLVCPNCGFPGEQKAPAPAPDPTPTYAPSAPAPEMSPPSAYGSSPYPGQPYGTTPYVPGMLPLKTSGKAITSMVLGIIGLIPYVGWVLGPVAIFLAVSARKDIRNNPQTIGGGGFATTGLILGIIDCALVVITIILAALVFTLVSDLAPSPTP